MVALELVKVVSQGSRSSDWEMWLSGNFTHLSWVERHDKNPPLTRDITELMQVQQRDLCHAHAQGALQQGLSIREQWKFIHVSVRIIWKYFSTVILLYNSLGKGFLFCPGGPGTWKSILIHDCVHPSHQLIKTELVERQKHVGHRVNNSSGRFSSDCLWIKEWN